MDFFLKLRAKSPDSALNRDYSLEFSIDLFGQAIVTTAWGRHGHPGRRKSVSFEEAKHAYQYARTRILARRSAPRRIGTQYLVREAIGFPATSNINLESILPFFKNTVPGT